MSNTIRTEARNVILQLRRYRDRIQELASTAAGPTAAGGLGGAGMLRKVASLKADLVKDAHECGIGRKRMVQTECEHDFLWPALREAAAAMGDGPGPETVEAWSMSGLRSAQTRIQHYLGQLEGRWPTL